jgi:general secretion pathway protein G
MTPPPPRAVWRNKWRGTVFILASGRVSPLCPHRARGIPPDARFTPTNKTNSGFILSLLQTVSITMKTTCKANRPPRRRPRKAFTLVEIIIVIALIGVIMSLTIPQIAGIFEDSKVDAEKLKVTKTLPSVLMRYNTHVGHYPSTEEGLGVLLNPPQNGADRWKGPYVDSTKDLTDSWDNPYQYKYPGTRKSRSFDLWSVGPDKQDGTGDDIGNWGN